MLFYVAASWCAPMAAGNELGFEVLFGNGQVADEFRLRAHGLRAEKVTVYACKLKRTCSHAVYKVSGGAIDTWTSASSGGSYAGVDPEGLFWSQIWRREMVVSSR